jgi:hypothetical protein
LLRGNGEDVHQDHGQGKSGGAPPHSKTGLQLPLSDPACVLERARRGAAFDSAGKPEMFGLS